MLRFDAIEFSPAAKESIHAVFDESKREGHVLTEKNLLGASWWFDFAERLKKKTGISWRTPVELNPEINYE